MMRKLSIILFMLIAVKANAQFFAGVKLGINVSNQFFTYKTSSSSYNYSYNGSSSNSKIQTLGNWTTGLHAGITAGYYFRNAIGLQTEFAYMTTGFSFKDQPTYNINIDYLQWTPVLLKLFAGRPKKSCFFISTGFSFGFPIRGQVNTPGLLVEDPDDPSKSIQVDKLMIKEYVNSPDISWIIGLGLSFPVGNGKLEFEGRCLYGLTNIYTDEFRTNFLGLNYSVHNLNLVFQTGYILFLSRK